MVKLRIGYPEDPDYGERLEEFEARIARGEAGSHGA